ncbi:MAG: M48 family metallopeptidase [Thermoplasmata archaeon]|nr:M48 family metallopeptidase [Thermoplasmata archaeon]
MLVILPENYGNEKKLIEKYKEWIYKKHLFIEEAKREAKRKKVEWRSEEELKEMIEDMVEEFSKELNVKVNRIYFRKLKSKWGSCSNKGNISFNTMLKYLPEELIRYVVFHEMIHLRERRHNKNFWEMMGKKFDDYEKKEKELFAYWFLIQNLKS